MENNKLKRQGLKGYLTGLIIASVVIIYYTVMLSVSPGRKMTQLIEDFGPEPPESGDYNAKSFSDSVYLTLLKEKTFLQARNQLAQTDSIYLTLNLSDSISELEISGVCVHTAKISSYKMSSILEKGDRNVIFTVLSGPLTIGKYRASIKKEPVMIKIAPKDTSEYQPDVIPDTSMIEPVNFILEMTNGIRLYVYQDEEETASDWRSISATDMKDRLLNTWNALKSVAVFKVPEYHPFIKIRIPRADGKIIFRALPANGQVIIYT